jgi:hypothetical protein
VYPALTTRAVAGSSLVSSLKDVHGPPSRTFSDEATYPAPLTGTPEDPVRGEREAGRFLMFDGEYANITGNPAMSVPLAVDSAGQPVGMSFLAGFRAEATLFRLASQLEQALGRAAARTRTIRMKETRHLSGNVRPEIQRLGEVKGLVLPPGGIA